MGVQSSSGMASMILRRALVQADGDGEADLRLATDGHHVMGVEAAVGAHVSTRPTVSRRKAVLARFRSLAISTSLPAATASSGW